MSFAFAFRCHYMRVCQIFVIFAYGSKRVCLIMLHGIVIMKLLWISLMVFENMCFFKR